MLTNIFNTIAQDHAINDQIRRYDSPMASRHLANEVAPGVVDRDARDRRGELFRSPTIITGSKRGCWACRRWRRTTSTPPSPTNMPACEYATGRDTVLTAFERFHPTMRDVAAKFFDNNWIDAEVRPGKRGGAFSASTVPGVHPYILLNWTDKLRDVSTMAHELGHGIHQYLSRKQTYLNFHHPLTIAETASVFGEFLTFDYVMETTSDPEVRLGLLCSKIEDAFATVFRQNVLTRFEQIDARRAAQGETIDRRDLRSLVAGEPGPVRRCGRDVRPVPLGLVVHPALHPHAVLLLRLCVRRAPRAVAVPHVPGRRERRLCRAI